MSTKADQADILAELETLRPKLAAAEANVTKLTKDLEAANATAAKVPKLETDLSAVTKERDDLKAENEKLTTQMADFNARVATELAKHGIRKEGVEAPKREAAGTTSEEGLIEQYNALTDPAARAVFIAKNGDKLRDLVRHNR